MVFENVTIFGIGLIGASVGLGLKEKGLCRRITGSGRNEENLKRAKALRIIDDFSRDPAKASDGADLVVLATPVGAFRDIVTEIKDSLKESSVVTDVGSVKGGLVYELESLMPDGVCFIGAHPIAGGESSGIDDSRADLFRNARCIITPTENSDPAAIGKISSLWQNLGGRVEFMDPFKHDEIYAAVSHLPHIIAYSLVNTVRDFDSECIGYAGQGFRDTTRIALSPPEVWKDISLFNRENILKLIKMLKGNLTRLEEMLGTSDGSGIAREFGKAREFRMKLSSGGPHTAGEDPGTMATDQGL